jgi:hypothetical protein
MVRSVRLCDFGMTGAAAPPPLPQSAAKRYKVTGSGKVMVRRAGKQHLNEKQSRKTKRNLRWALRSACST